jgi:hypothetical protein
MRSSPSRELMDIWIEMRGPGMRPSVGMRRPRFPGQEVVCGFDGSEPRVDDVGGQRGRGGADVGRVGVMQPHEIEIWDDWTSEWVMGETNVHLHLISA